MLIGKGRWNQIWAFEYFAVDITEIYKNEEKNFKYLPLDWPCCDITPKRGMWENDYIVNIMHIYVQGWLVHALITLLYTCSLVSTLRGRLHTMYAELNKLSYCWWWVILSVSGKVVLDYEKFVFFGEVPCVSENKSAKRKQLRCVPQLQSSTRCLIIFLQLVYF